MSEAEAPKETPEEVPEKKLEVNAEQFRQSSLSKILEIQIRWMNTWF